MGSGGWVLSIEEAAALVVGSGGLIGDGLSGELAGAFDVELNLVDGDDDGRSPGEGVKEGGRSLHWGEEDEDGDEEEDDGEEDDEEGEDDDISD